MLALPTRIRALSAAAGKLDPKYGCDDVSATTDNTTALKAQLEEGSVTCIKLLPTLYNLTTQISVPRDV